MYLIPEIIPLPQNVDGNGLYSNSFIVQHKGEEGGQDNTANEGDASVVNIGEHSIGENTADNNGLLVQPKGIYSGLINVGDTTNTGINILNDPSTNDVLVSHVDELNSNRIVNVEGDQPGIPGDLHFISDGEGDDNLLMDTPNSLAQTGD